MIFELNAPKLGIGGQFRHSLLIKFQPLVQLKGSQSIYVDRIEKDKQILNVSEEDFTLLT